MVSVNSAGAPGNDESECPAVSPDGRFVVFHSGATNFAPVPVWGPGNQGFWQVFLRDRGDNGAPVAQFSGAPTAGTLPLTVTFTDASSNSPTSWSWNFGDGETSTEQNPTYAYANAGLYIVSLIATNALGSGSCTKDGYITVTFTDVPLDFWALYQILVCVDDGIVKGYSDGTYHPGDAVTAGPNGRLRRQGPGQWGWEHPHRPRHSQLQRCPCGRMGVQIHRILSLPGRSAGIQERHLSSRRQASLGRRWRSTSPVLLREGTPMCLTPGRQPLFPRRSRPVTGPSTMSSTAMTTASWPAKARHVRAGLGGDARPDGRLRPTRLPVAGIARVEEP